MRIKTTLLSATMSAILFTAGTAQAVVVSKVTFKNTQLSTFAFVETQITCADQTEGVASAQLSISGGSFVKQSRIKEFIARTLSCTSFEKNPGTSPRNSGVSASIASSLPSFVTPPMKFIPPISSSP